MGEFKFNLGECVMEELTGFRGKIIGRADYTDEVNYYLVQPRCENDNKRLDGHWIPEGRLIVG